MLTWRARETSKGVANGSMKRLQTMVPQFGSSLGIRAVCCCSALIVLQTVRLIPVPLFQPLYAISPSRFFMLPSTASVCRRICLVAVLSFIA